MFTNLIESELHVKEFKRRSSFFLITVAAYSVILFAAGIVSVYAYDAQLEAQTSSLELLQWVPPVNAAVPKPVRDVRPTIRKQPQTNAPVDPHIRQPVRTDMVASTSDPNKVPDGITVKPVNVVPWEPGSIKGTRNANPPVIPMDSNACVSCNSAPPLVKVDEKPPEPVPVKPPTTHRISTGVLISKVVSLPQPSYPAMAKQIRLQGVVSIQILVDEQGKVISAQAVSGHPILTGVSKEAALRARFTPTILNGQPVKVQGVITYNFVLQ
jgi:periplasmic protein TonB